MSLELPQTFELHLGEKSARAVCKVVYGSSSEWVWANFSMNFKWVLGYLLGIYAAITAGLDFIALIIAMILSSVIYSVFFPSKNNAGYRKRTIKVEIRDSGLAEYDEGVESFSPWSSMIYWGISSGHLVVALKNHLFAVISDIAVDSSAIDLQSIGSLLKEKGVQEKMPV